MNAERELLPDDVATEAGASRAPGRPRRAGIDDAILQAAIELIASEGINAATVDAVARRAGVARATVYLRWPTHDALVAAAMRLAIGRDAYPLTGDIAADVGYASEQARLILSEPAFTRMVPALMQALLQPEGPTAISYDTIAPNRKLVAAEYRELAEAAGFRTDIDPELIGDLLIGAMLNRLLATGRPPTTVDAYHAAEIVLAGLRAVPPKRPRGRRGR